MSVKSLAGSLRKENRLLLEADLKPLQGDRFQPTGFPHLGASTYVLPDGTEMLLVESAQSMANHLEKPCWDEEKQELAECLKGMPYIRVVMGDKFLTSSILEPHRLASPYILRGKNKNGFRKTLVENLKNLRDRVVDNHSYACILLKYDPNSIIHGFFLADTDKELLSGRFRLPRLLSAVIEARDIQQVESGGAKHDRITPRGNTAQGFGHVPYGRTEYVAAEITAYFNLDLATLRSYRLGKDAENFLIALSLWKIRSFLEDGLRLRTACDLECEKLCVAGSAGFTIPKLAKLEKALPDLIKAVKEFADPAVTKVAFDPPSNWKGKDKEVDKNKTGDSK